VKKVRIIWIFLEKFGKSGVKMGVNLEKFGIIWKKGQRSASSATKFL